MAVIDYSEVTKATIVNNGSADITIQLYRVNLWETIKAGDTLVLNIETSEEAIYYVALSEGSTTPTDVYTLLTEEPSNWATNYTDYYKKNQDDEFVPNDDSTWATDTFYSKSVIYVSGGSTVSVTIE